MDTKGAVKTLLGVFSESNQCSVHPVKNDRCSYFFLDAMPREMRSGGPYSAGPTWMLFAVAGEGMDTDLLARAEMLIGEVEAAKGLLFAMRRHFTSTQPFYALSPIEDRLFLFMIQDRIIPLAVGQESLEARLQMELSVNMMSDAIPGIKVHPDVFNYVAQRHKPHSWDVPASQFIDIVS